jgi:hypothetical protein
MYMVMAVRMAVTVIVSVVMIMVMGVIFSLNRFLDSGVRMFM